MYNAHILPEFLRENYGCTLHMGIMFTYHRYNNGHNKPVYNAYKMWVRPICSKTQYLIELLENK